MGTVQYKLGEKRIVQTSVRSVVGTMTDRKTNCDVCNKTHYCARTGRIYKDPDGHWQIKLHTTCLIDEETEYALSDG